MDIKDLMSEYAHHPGVKVLGRFLRDKSKSVIGLDGVQGSSLALIFSSLSVSAPAALNAPFVFVADDLEEAGYLYHELELILGEEGVLLFPSSFRRGIKNGQKDDANEISRTKVLSRLASGKLPLFVVTYPDAMCEQVVSHKELSDQTLELHRGDTVDITFLQDVLLGFGFQRTDYVYEPGQFAVRGCIVDIYSFSSEYPYRVDFFGDDIESIRTFEIQTQLSKGMKDSVTIVPELQHVQESVLTFLPPESVLVMHDLVYLCDAVDRAYQEGFSRQAEVEQKATGEQKVWDRDALLVPGSQFEREVVAFRRVEVRASASGQQSSAICSEGADGNVLVHFHVQPQPLFHKNFDLVYDALSHYLGEGYKLYVLADSLKQTERLKAIFQDQERDLPFMPVEHTLHAGFVDADMKMVCFTDHQIFDRYHKYNLRSEKVRSAKMALTLKELQQFEVGDYVVHVDHGIGRFGGLCKVDQGGSSQEVIKIDYEGSGTIYVSIHSLHKVNKYRGKDGEPPRISKLGSGAWERMKERTKSKIKDIARDLIKLYARRREEKGFAFSPDSYLQHELEASFLYEDTPDQSRATLDVKTDMEKSRPMDRLVCGDVGFGKTEVAIRAAFKACTDSKQVVVLVPTTVLAYQHYHTFLKRLQDFPVKVEYLSRARSAAQTKAVLAGLADGSVDIVVGTHKLIGKGVKFKDLGLLIIDEEQKFGVSTKEKLRQMKANVDTLTLTATPIPRTLQFSLMGARDLSVIQTPPPNRYPIQTELHDFSAQVIADAVNFEMSRNGQVYIVTNRISSLPELVAVVNKHVPDARVCVGHGRMNSEELEHVILDFSNYDYDVLISTTIVENGIDIPNANTIIINNAHTFGLSDLHQMRGRVGRSNKKAFCYLLSPPLGLLPAESRRRLKAVENFSDLGSGIHLAMQDLDIRGAGNLLGAEQSGFIGDLGYETYQKILNEAVHELRNDEFRELYEKDIEQGEKVDGADFVDDCLLESDLQLFFSEQYVPTSAERMLLYRELDGLETDEQISQFRKRMEDRFGPIPPEGQALIDVVKLRRLGKYFGATRIVLKNRRMRMFLVDELASPYYQSDVFGKMISYCFSHAAQCGMDTKGGHQCFYSRDVNSVQQAIKLLEMMERESPKLS
ncbi:MAG: transcription-repair coupling factor [Bacteroidales bacterium]|nr:transcription-repair coupling factor [Bacteroidales bacterium]